MPEIYLYLNGQQTGPYQPAQLRQLLAEGKITAEIPAWHKDLTDWSTVAQVLAQFPAPASGPPPYVPPSAPPAPSPQKKGMSGCTIAAIIVGAILVLLLPCCAGIALGSITNGIKKAKENTALQQSRALGLAMFAYASDHNGTYPDGKTSTEVFQKLLDQKYISDPGLFYIFGAPGKMKATTSTLTTANVCFDVTSGVTADSSNDLPVVFSTGYTVTYIAGASATKDSGSVSPFPGMAVAFKSNRAQFFNADAELDGNVPAIVPTTFDPGTKTYQQLRP
jgi:hypothetical protein